jgi:hypothetical protein
MWVSDRFRVWPIAPGVGGVGGGDTDGGCGQLDGQCQCEATRSPTSESETFSHRGGNEGEERVWVWRRRCGPLDVPSQYVLKVHDVISNGLCQLLSTADPVQQQLTSHMSTSIRPYT